MPVSSRVALATPGLPSTVPRPDSRRRREARRGCARALQGPGVETGFVVRVTQVKVGEVVFGGDRLVLIAGPCVIENRESCLRHAERLVAIARRAGFPLVFKSSFDKANRTSHKSFRGPGLDAGLSILAEVKRQFGVPVLTDVHEATQVRAAAEVVDVLQIPALLSRQTDLIKAAAAT